MNIPDMADNMKKYGGFIPRIAARQTDSGLSWDRIVTRITLAGSVFLAIIAISA